MNKKNPQELFIYSMSFKVSHREYEFLKRKAEGKHLSLSSFIRLRTLYDMKENHADRRSREQRN